MTSLEEKLTKLKSINESTNVEKWGEYKESWVNSINLLYSSIMNNFFEDYEAKGLMKFAVIPVVRFESYFGEYVTAILEITLVNSKSLIIEPIAAVTTEYYGRLDFYLSGNINKKVSIYRELTSASAFNSNSKFEWILAKSTLKSERVKLSKIQIEKLIEQWLS